MMTRDFKMIDLGSMKYFFDLEVKQSERHFCVLRKVCWKILNRFKMKTCNLVLTPLEGIEAHIEV